MSKLARFWDRHAERYARQPVADEAAYQRKLETTRRYLRPDMEVLEFGCGTGSTALVHAPHVRHILAIDLSGKMIEIARGKAQAQGIENVEFRQATLGDLDLEGGALDLVLGLNILHLMDDIEAVIGEAHRLLSPGGLFVTSTLCLGDSQRWIRYLSPVGEALGVMPPINVFTTAELEACMRGAGFQIEDQWQPGPKKAVFMVARKAGAA